tara:strand:+ start:48 stop:518 length:471 start_codon:yes stop_codon:yes gene_type:complete
MTKKTLKDTKEAAKLIRNYCAIQERCIFDVRSKLQGWGILYKDIREIIKELVHHNFINESRYAKTFCRGKFNIKKWGRMKIIYEMKKKNISEDDINQGIRIIDNHEYKKVLESLYIRKSKSIKIKDKFKKEAKIAKFLQQKGFETNMIWELINNTN